MKKIIKYFILLFIFTLTICFSTLNTKADTGPHAYTKISINGDTKGMYMTLLSKKSHSGPHAAYSEYERDYSSEDEIIQKVNKKFIEYEDSDSFYYLQAFSLIEKNEYSWNYMPPDTFKILIYDSINDNFITDNKIYEKKEFATIYKVILEPESLTFMAIKETKSVGGNIASFFVRFTICLSIEILIALAFGFRKKELLPILFVNLATQILLNVILAIDIYNNGFNMMNILTHAYIPLELGILIVESLAYIFIYRKFKFGRENNISIPRILIYTLIANLVSFLVGFAIISILVNLNIFV